MENIENYIKIGKGKVNNRWYKTLILAIMAGVFIAMAGFASTLISAGTTNFSIGRFLSGIIFPIGLILVILFKTELFTGNSLLIIPLVNKDIKFKELIKNWILVYLGNLIGSILFSLLVYFSNMYTKIGTNFVNIANNKLSYSIITLLILGFLCNFLVCAAVYLGVNAKNNIEKVLLIFIPIFLFIVLGLEHSVANMFYLSMAFCIQRLSLRLILKNLVFVTIGNIIGGITFGLSQYYLNK